LIVEDGAKLEYIKKSDLDTQFLSSREFVNTQICGAFRVPPHLIANLSKSSFSNITEQSEELVKYTLRPFIKNIEKSINLQLLSKKDQKNHYCKFNLDSLLRGTPKARADYYSSMRNIGAFSINDIRALENLNKIAQGDDYTSPLNSNQTTQDQNQENTTTTPAQKENTTTNE
jgi:HK97 family phage portal protein